MTPHARGFLLTLFGVLVLTPDTLLIRLIASDPWTVAACRGALSGSTILLAFIVLRRGAAFGEIRRLGAVGLLVCALNAVNAVAFVVALHHTSVANTLIIMATAPLMAALMSFAVLREAGNRPSVSRWTAKSRCC